MRCCVPGCMNDTNATDSDGITYHRFPKELSLKKSWLEALDIIDWIPEEYSAVCSEHFQRDAFYETKCGIRRVKREAVPVSDIEIFSIFETKPIKMETNAVEIEIDIKNVKIEQELPDDGRIESSKPVAEAASNDTNTTESLDEDVQVKVENESLCDNKSEMKNSCQCPINSKNTVKISHTEEIDGKKSRNSCFDGSKKIKRLKLKKLNTEIVTYFCDHCNYKSTKRPCFVEHIKTLSGVRRFACQKCNYKTVQSGKLTRHMWTHTGAKPIACQMCNYRCVTKQQLTIHMGTHTGEKPFACQMCDYRCMTKYDLNKHTKMHIGEKPFACKLCDYICMTKYDLTKHSKIHTGAKQFACQKCDFKTVLSGKFTTHMWTHSGT